MLRFTPSAWAKLQYFCHRGETEIGGFGLSHADDPLLIADFLTLKQRTTSVTVAFEDEAVADLLDQQVDAGIAPDRFSRVWIHTHPGQCSQPSGTDEETFDRVFGPCEWAVMAIIARGGETYARLRFNVGPGGQVLVPMAVDYSQPFAAADHAAWEADYQRHVQPVADALEYSLEDVDVPAFNTPNVFGEAVWLDPDEDDALDAKMFSDLDGEIESLVDQEA